MCNFIKFVWLGCEKHSQILPKNGQKQPFSDFFRFSQTLSNRFERNFLQSFYTKFWSFMCNFIKFVWLGCEKHSQIYPKNGQKNSHFSIFSIFSKTVHTIRTKASQKEKDLSRLLYRICGSDLIIRCFLNINLSRKLGFFM